MSLCAICNAPSEKKCSLCLAVYYCSKEHQKLDWKSHKAKCISYKIEENAELGRHLIAQRKISPGQEILREAPIVSGPMQITQPVCLGCYKLLTAESSIECPKCGWPMCSIDCAKKSDHFPECRISTKYRESKVNIKTFGIQHPSYECITALRCLYMKTDRPSKWEKLNKLQSHCEQRKDTEKYANDRRNVAQFIHRFFKFTEFTEEEILRVVGLVNINGHEVPLSGNDFVSVYEMASYLEHNCRANCSKSFSSSGELVIRAAKAIEPGEHISICYTDPLWGTINRRQHLLETKFFSCNCERCTDPTEFGSNFSSLRCTASECKGFLTMKNPTDASTIWICSKCEAIPSSEAIRDVIAEASVTVMSTDRSKKSALLTSIKKLENMVHPNHYFTIDCKLSVTQLLDEGVTQLSDDDLSIKLLYCRQLYKLLMNLVPAENRCLGVLLFGKHAALAETGRRRSNRGEIDADDLKNNLLECQEILKESYRLLRFEPDVLPEGKMAKQAKVNLSEIEKILQTIQIASGSSPM